MAERDCKSCVFKSAAGKELNPEEFDIVQNNSALVFFKKGDLIFKEGALSTNVAYLRTGIAKVHKKGPASDKIMRIVKAPTYMGIPTTFGDKINQYSATALEDASVCFIDSNLFRNFILKNGAFAYQIIVELCENELNDYERYANQSQKQVPGMLAETLLCMSEKIFNSPRFVIPLNQSEMANLIGASRESINRVLADFCANGLIEFAGKEVNILNPDALEEISEKG